jgi:two-component system, NtrC family, response regulator HydG
MLAGHSPEFPRASIIPKMTPETNSDAALPAPPPLKLLVVDNDEALARAMEESLVKVGYECTVATSGPEGARKIETDTYDIVVTDLVMNDVDGMEILARSRERLPDAEVILVTGHASVPKAVEAMQLGAFNFLEKPITPNRLRAVCEKAADAIRLKQQNAELRSGSTSGSASRGSSTPATRCSR